MSEQTHKLPGDIERTSLAIIAEELAQRGLTPPPENEAVVRRVWGARRAPFRPYFNRLSDDFP